MCEARSYFVNWEVWASGYPLVIDFRRNWVLLFLVSLEGPVYTLSTLVFSFLKVDNHSLVSNHNLRDAYFFLRETNILGPFLYTRYI